MVGEGLEVFSVQFSVAETRVLPDMIVRQSSGHFLTSAEKGTGLHYPKILANSQQKAGKRNFNEK